MKCLGGDRGGVPGLREEGSGGHGWWKILEFVAVREENLI